ncbi:MAG TPA: MFS transporter, partial [Dissulfurispiraceae bacterium]|nr:MFS transporter [Dissulfurispiraceae bacterium]
IYVSSMIGAGFFGRVFGGVLSGQLGWRTAFIIFSLLNLAGGVLMLRYLPPSSRFRGKGGVLESLAGLFRHLGSCRLLGVFIIAFMLFFTFTGAFTYVTFHLSAPPYSLSTTSLGLLFFIYIAGVVSPAAGSLSSRYGRTPVICAGLITASGGMLLTFLPHLWVIIGGLFLLCAGLFISQPAASALVGDLAREGKGSASSLYLFFYYTGGGAGAIVPGLLWHSRGWHGVVAICLLSIGAAFVSLFTFCRDSSQRREQQVHSQ